MVLLACGIAATGCKKKEEAPAKGTATGEPAAAEAGTTAEPAAAPAAPAPRSLCLAGGVVIKGGDGSVIGNGGMLLRYDFDPEKSVIHRRWVMFDNPMGQPPEAVEVDLRVEGDAYTFEAEAYSGKGELRGEPWAWQSWTMEADLPQRAKLRMEESLTDGGLRGTDDVLDPAGNLAMRAERTLTAASCDGWDERREKALAGTLHLADIGITPATPEEPVDDATGNWREEEVTFESHGRQVAGTITRPLGDGPFPAVLFHAGSGPTDRNWNNTLVPGTNGSAKLLARVLAENGFASLRFDKMGTGKTEIPPAVASRQEGVRPQHFLDDVRAALARLAEGPGIDPARIFMIGNSEGGLYTLRTAMDPEAKLAGIVLMASQGAAQGPTVLRQLRAQLEAAGTAEAAAEQIAKLENAMRLFVEGQPLPPPQEVSDNPNILGILQGYFNPASAELGRWLLAWDPATAFAEIRIPVLILQGEKDLQITLETDANPLHEAAKAAGLEDVTLVVLPESDHVFKHEPAPLDQIRATGALRYNAAGRTLDPAAVEALLGWLRAHAATEAAPE
jgi:alpha-beta hydrolase superfamily lysophospholipase